MEPPSPPPASVRKIAIVGTGVIGSGWTAVFLAKKYEVCAFVRSEASEKKFYAFLQKAWSKVHARGLTSDADGWKRVKCVRNLAECVATADYVQESVVEAISLKQDILQQIDEHAPAGVIIGTSSSFIPASLCAARAKFHPRRIATVHPTLPQFDAFVEVYGLTSAVTAWTVDFFGPQHVGMDVVVVQRENHGHVLNALTNSVCTTATMLVNSGVCSARDADRSLVHLARMIVSSGGVAGAMVGFVGGGSVEATTELASDIMIGAPMGVGASLIGRFFGSGQVAALLLWLLQLVASVWTSSRLVKRLGLKFMNWWNRSIYDRWHEIEEGWEARNMQALVALEAMPPV